MQRACQTTNYQIGLFKKKKKKKKNYQPGGLKKKNSNTMLKCDPNIALYNVTKRNHTLTFNCFSFYPTFLNFFVFFEVLRSFSNNEEIHINFKIYINSKSIHTHIKDSKSKYLILKKKKKTRVFCLLPI